MKTLSEYPYELVDSVVSAFESMELDAFERWVESHKNSKDVDAIFGILLFPSTSQLEKDSLQALGAEQITTPSENQSPP